MTTTEIILAIISSSVLASILTSLVNWIIHRSNYKHDYYKKLLNKRLDAYEKLNSIVGRLSIHTQLENIVIPTICFDEKYFNNYLVSLALTVETSFWLSSNTSTKLTELNVFLLNNISNKTNESFTKGELENIYQHLGEQNRENLRKFRKELRQMMNKDLENLHNVKQFFKPNKSNQTFKINMREK